MAQNDIATNLADNNTNWINVKNAIENKGVSTQNKTTGQYAGLIGQINGNLQSLSVTPSTSTQQIVPTSPVDGYDEVVVAAVTAAIDNNIQSQNIKKNVSILGIVGSYEASGGTYETMSVEPDFSNGDVVIQPSTGYDAIDQITIEKADTLISSNIKAGVNVHGILGSYSGGGSNYEQKSVTPDFSSGDVTVTPDSGYDALSSVVIQKDSDLTPQNIKKDVEINGIIGTYTGSGVAVNPHPTNLQYACTDGASYANVLPADGSWTTDVDLTGIASTNNMRYMFNNNTVVEDLDLTGWTVPDIAVACTNMFNGCTNLKYVRGSLSFAKSTNLNSMFANCSSLITCGIVNFGFSATSSSLTLDLSASAVLDATSMISNMDTNSSGKTRILKLHSTVLSGLSQATLDLAASKNITLQ